MKNRFLTISTAFLAFVAITGCSSDNKPIDDIFEGAQKGAFLRTTETNSLSFNAFDPTSVFDIAVEYQDGAGSKLLSTVDVYMDFTDNNGGGNTKPEQLITSIPASAFTTGAQYGLPVTDIVISLQEALTAFGLTAGQYTGGDNFKVRLDLKLTDGRSYTDVDANGNIAALGGYYSSPFAYNAGVKCIPLTPIAGDYVMNMNDDYGDSWDGAFITVTIDGVSTDYTVPASAGTDVIAYPISVPNGTTELVFTYTPGAFESEHIFEIIAPNGDVAAESPGVEGEIILNICI